LLITDQSHGVKDKIYVDDMILAGLSDQLMRIVMEALSQRFDINELGSLNNFLGVIVNPFNTRLILRKKVDDL